MEAFSLPWWLLPFRVSKNYGAGRVDRIRRAMKSAYLYNAAVTIGRTLLMAVFAPYMIKLISGSEEQIIIENGTRYLQVVAPAYFVLGLVNNTRTALQAIGSIMQLFSVSRSSGVLWQWNCWPHFGEIRI